MQKIKKHPLFVPGAVAFVIFFSLGALGAINILAQTSITNTTSYPCEYSANTCSKWGACEIGDLEYCKSFYEYPSGCQPLSDPPLVHRPCTYTHPTCEFTCLEWGPCRPDGTRECIKTQTSDPNCSGGTPPAPRTCTYSAPPCEYTYSDWSPCDSYGYQYRKVKSELPSGCYGTPLLRRSCTYSAPDSGTTNDSTAATGGTTSSGGSSGGETVHTTTYNLENVSSCHHHCSSWSSCRSEGYRIRQCYSPAGETCVIREEKQPCASFSSSGSGSAPAQCSNACSDWSVCTPAGLQFQKCWPAPAGCPGEPIQNERKCVPVFCNFNYSPWSACADGIKYRSIVSAFPSGCVRGEQKLKEECVSTGGEPAPDQAPEAAEKLVDPQFAVSGEWKKEKFGTEKCAEEICGGLADPDGDGLSNNDELRYGTDPLNRDTDDDGKTDGEEVAAGASPLKSSARGEEDEIKFEDAKTAGEVKKEIYKVENVQMVGLESGEKGLLISGRGPAGSYVAVYVYSDLPTVLSLKTDAAGNWAYTLEEQIEDGEHQVFVAVTDNEGRVKSKSEPLPFVKTAQAVTVARGAGSGAEEAGKAIPGISLKNIMFILALGFFGVVVAFILIGWVIKKTVERIKMN